MNATNTDVFAQVGGLEARGAKMKKRGTRFLIAALVVLAIAGIGAVTGWAISPSATPGNIDVPQVLVSTLSDQVAGSEGGGLQSLPFTSVAGSLMDFMTGPALFAMAVLGVVVAGAALVFGGELSGFVRSIFMMAVGVGVILMASNLVNGMFGRDDAKQADPSPRARFMAAVEAKNYERVQTLINEAPFGAASAADYVLAQIAVAEGLDRKPGARVIVGKAAGSMAMPPAALGFTPRGEAAYAIERSAYGEPRSSTAKQYQQEWDRKAATWWAMAGVAGIIGAILAAAATGFVGLAVSIRNRVKRVRDLLVMEPGAEP
ncbi:TrbC/VirB2 family protein [Pseudomonas aeruginosa]|uniref:TrbC/VirB2 family protein n=1 Tax=Gammaproteobacteria TaxID=1236 RepID=UPI0015F01BAD|nr:TrbC/VirB2 family protein [Pseudomonas aeruginosa]MBA4953708.1 TrbC/VirB2 family protein [Pseudomonas aeruginosa]HDX2569724.1 TrbC/VirB2 family protein [Escherichia coli]